MGHLPTPTPNSRENIQIYIFSFQPATRQVGEKRACGRTTQLYFKALAFPSICLLQMGRLLQ